MSRNENRLGPQVIPMEQDGLKKPEKSFFTIPVSYNVVKLPTEGRFYPEDHPWHNKENIEMREMTTKHEELLANKQLLAQGTAMDKVLKDLFVDAVDVDQIFIVDKNAIILDVVKNNYDKDYKVKVKCPVCGEPKVEDVDLNLVSTKPLPDDPEIPSEMRVPVDPDGVFYIELKDKNGKVVAKLAVRLLTGEDEKSLKLEEEKKKKHKLPYRPVASLLQKIIVSINGDQDSEQIAKFVENLPSFYSRQIQNEYKRLVPTVELFHKFVCIKESCKHEAMLEIPLDANFFRPNQ